MSSLAVVTGIAYQRRDTLSADSLREGLSKFAVIRLGTASNHRREEQMSGGVAGGRKLGISVFYVAFVPVAASCVVGRNVSGFQARGVDGGQLAGLADQAALASDSNRCIKQPLRAPFFRMRDSA